MASKRRIRKNGCTGKIAYKTKEAAQAVVRSMVKRGRAIGFINAYPCQFGNHYHVGRRPSS